MILLKLLGLGVNFNVLSIRSVRNSSKIGDEVKRITSLATGVATTVMMAMAPLSAQATEQYQSGTTGVDISWPNCNTKIPAGTPFGIVGLSNGLVYSDNPCAQAEAKNFASVSLYVNTGLNTAGTYYQEATTTSLNDGTCTAGDQKCFAHEYGYLAAKEAYNYAVSQGIASGVTRWWLDVETGNTWNSDTSLNVASLQGEQDAIVALADPGSTVGIYSTSSQWKSIVGTNWPAANTWPVWYATGQTSASRAKPYCGASYSFTKGPINMAQYVAKGLDWDYAC